MRVRGATKAPTVWHLAPAGAARAGAGSARARCMAGPTRHAAGLRAHEPRGSQIGSPAPRTRHTRCRWASRHPHSGARRSNRAGFPPALGRGRACRGGAPNPRLIHRAARARSAPLHLPAAHSALLPLRPGSGRPPAARDLQDHFHSRQGAPRAGRAPREKNIRNQHDTFSPRRRPRYLRASGRIRSECAWTFFAHPLEANRATAAQIYKLITEIDYDFLRKSIFLL